MSTYKAEEEGRKEMKCVNCGHAKYRHSKRLQVCWQPDYTHIDVYTCECKTFQKEKEKK